MAGVPNHVAEMSELQKSFQMDSEAKDALGR